MNNYIFLSPNALQFTYEKDYLQGKETCFSQLTIKEGIKKPSQLFFSEKYISGFLNILNLISSGDVIYFTLPKIFNENSTIQFVYNLIAACKYNKPSFIVFDKRICMNVKQYYSNSLEHSNFIQKLFEESGLPIIYLNSNDTKYNQSNISNLKLKSLQFHNLNNVEINFSKLEAISKKINHVFDLKEVLTGEYKFQYTEKKTKIKNVSFECSYTLN